MSEKVLEKRIVDGYLADATTRDAEGSIYPYCALDPADVVDLCESHEILRIVVERLQATIAAYRLLTMNIDDDEEQAGTDALVKDNVRLRKERDEARRWVGFSPMMQQCHHCGHRLRFESDGCPQCGGDALYPWEEPEEQPDICECERCVKARVELGERPDGRK